MVLEKLKSILSEQFDVSTEDISPDSDIANDLGADSLDVVDLFMAIESEFDIEIPDDEIENLRTVGQLAKYIETQSSK